MKALILAAGRGERLRPLTDTTPKPLLFAGGRRLIDWHLQRLAAHGVREVVINTAWLAEQFPLALGDGSRFGLGIVYSYEGARALETGGALLAARELVGEAPFLLVNGDIWSDFDFAALPAQPPGLAHLVMVDAAAHAPRGDFALDAQGRLQADGAAKLTYAGIGVYRMALLDRWNEHVAAIDSAPPPRFPLAPLLRAHMHAGAITGQHHRGRWTDVGTQPRLRDLDEQLADAATG